ncbi:MAG: hypothetical protein A4E57_01917 [Syntrophorhabdaceae bacterium PtaU1.Bin034]|nr:MAG: hypothetical protein A4E57_01917 [Syntrophorhabdaceae bacterium PtaU1.Bin034]
MQPLQYNSLLPCPKKYYILLLCDPSACYCCRCRGNDRDGLSRRELSCVRKSPGMHCLPQHGKRRIHVAGLKPQTVCLCRVSYACVRHFLAGILQTARRAARPLARNAQGLPGIPVSFKGCEDNRERQLSSLPSIYGPADNNVGSAACCLHEMSSPYRTPRHEAEGGVR